MWSGRVRPEAGRRDGGPQGDPSGCQRVAQNYCRKTDSEGKKSRGRDLRLPTSTGLQHGLPYAVLGVSAMAPSAGRALRSLVRMSNAEDLVSELAKLPDAELAAAVAEASAGRAALGALHEVAAAVAATAGHAPDYIDVTPDTDPAPGSPPLDVPVTLDQVEGVRRAWSHRYRRPVYRSRQASAGIRHRASLLSSQFAIRSSSATAPHRGWTSSIGRRPRVVASRNSGTRGRKPRGNAWNRFENRCTATIPTEPAVFS